MDFKQLRSFIAVIRYGSFTTAASKLRISQPTVSTHVRQLEEELGMPLIIRNAKRVELTPSGHKMYDQAVSMLAMHDRMLRSIRRKESDSIYLGASSIPSAYILPKIISGFCKEHSGARFSIKQGPSQAVLDGMLTGLYEIGFIGMPTNENALECMPFFHDKIVLVTPNEERFHEVDWSDRDAIVRLLKSERMIVRKAGSATRASSNRVLKDLGLENSDLDVLANLDDQESMKNLVESGAGVSLASSLAVRGRVNAGTMLAFDLPDIDTSRQFYILRRKNAQLSEAASEFYEFAVEQAVSK